MGWVFEKMQNQRTTSSRYLKKFRIQQPPGLSILKKKKQIQRTFGSSYFKNVYEPPSFMKEPPTNDLVVLGRCLIFSKELRTVIINNKWVFDFFDNDDYQLLYPT